MTPSALVDALEAGHSIDRRPYALNLVAARAPTPIPDRFDDALHAAWMTDAGVWAHRVVACTTDPGLYYLQSPMNVRGTAILCPGQYDYKLGKHRGRYTALVQAGPVTVWRDADRDALLDHDGPTDTGFFGINIHRANAHRRSTKVGRWSAGCIVVADPEECADSIITPAKRHEALHGAPIRLTLIEPGAPSPSSRPTSPPTPGAGRGPGGARD